MAVVAQPELLVLGAVGMVACSLGLLAVGCSRARLSALLHPPSSRPAIDSESKKKSLRVERTQSDRPFGSRFSRLFGTSDRPLARKENKVEEEALITAHERLPVRDYWAGVIRERSQQTGRGRKKAKSKRTTKKKLQEEEKRDGEKDVKSDQKEKKDVSDQQKEAESPLARSRGRSRTVHRPSSDREWEKWANRRRQLKKQKQEKGPQLEPQLGPKISKQPPPTTPLQPTTPALLMSATVAPRMAPIARPDVRQKTISKPKEKGGSKGRRSTGNRKLTNKKAAAGFGLFRKNRPKPKGPVAGV